MIESLLYFAKILTSYIAIFSLYFILLYPIGILVTYFILFFFKYYHQKEEKDISIDDIIDLLMLSLIWGILLFSYILYGICKLSIKIKNAIKNLLTKR